MAKKTKPAPSVKEPTAPMLRTRMDAWQNIITGQGTSRDKRTSATQVVPPASTDLQAYEDIYHGDDIGGTVAELPAQEMTREWFNLKTDDSSKTTDPKNKTGRVNVKVDDESRTEDDTDSVEDKMNTTKVVMQALEELDAQSKVFEAKVLARVFGGSLLFMGCDDGAAKMDMPLKEDSIRSFKFLQVFDRWDVQPASWYTDINNPKCGLPETYRINTHAHPVAKSTVDTGTTVHESRFLRFDGVFCNRRRRIRNQGWGDSVYVRVAEVIRDYGIAWGSAAHLLSDFAQSVFKMKGLANALLMDSDDLIMKRMTIMDLCRSTMRAVPLDADGEEFERKATPLSGMPELMQQFMMRLSAASGIPVSLFFGQAPAGLNATGASDIRFFYDRIKAGQKKELTPQCQRLTKLVMLSADGPTQGVEPDNWSIEWNPLWQLSEAEAALSRKTQAETDHIYISDGVTSPDEIAQSRFGGDRYSYETTLDNEQRDADKLAEEDAIKKGLLDPITRQPPPPPPEPKPPVAAE